MESVMISQHDRPGALQSSPDVLIIDDRTRLQRLAGCDSNPPQYLRACVYAQRVPGDSASHRASLDDTYRRTETLLKACSSITSSTTSDEPGCSFTPAEHIRDRESQGGCRELGKRGKIDN
jgi:hypothetical protein